MDLAIETRQAGDRTIIAVTGELDVHTAATLEKALTTSINAGDSRLLVDLSELAFLDSTGLGVLLKGLKWAQDVGGGLQVVADDDKIVKVFTITGLDRAVALAASLTEAGVE